MFDTPAVYHIQIEGKLDPAWSSRLEGMTICVAQNEHGRQVTTLSGELIDQAALSGVRRSVARSVVRRKGARPLDPPGLAVVVVDHLAGHQSDDAVPFRPPPAQGESTWH